MCVPVYADMWLSLCCVDTRLVYTPVPCQCACLVPTYGSVSLPVCTSAIFTFIIYQLIN